MATFTVSIGGDIDFRDVRAAKKLVGERNTRIAQENLVREQIGEPLQDLLPLEPAAALRDSYQTVMKDAVTATHNKARADDDEESLSTRAKTLWSAATDAQREAALAALQA